MSRDTLYNPEIHVLNPAGQVTKCRRIGYATYLLR
jgi:hypothetical protein